MKKNRNPYEVVCEDVCKIKKDERVLIIANPSTAEIAQNFYHAASDCGALPSLIYQPEKTSFDNANEEVLAAIKTNPDVCFSISAIKLGKDPHGAAQPYKTDDGQEFTHIFDFLLDGKLVGVSVVDRAKNALSSNYFYFDISDEIMKRSIGVFSVLAEIDACKGLLFDGQLKSGLYYLGYYIEDCNKMNYKSNYNPHELLIDGEWIRQ